MTLCMNHWLCFNTVVEHIFTLTGATWSSRNVIGPAQFMSYWPSSKGLKHLAHMNKESRGNILESTRDNIFVPQHKNSVLNADVSSKRGSSSQAPVLKKYSRPPKVMNVLKTAPQLRISEDKLLQGLKDELAERSIQIKVQNLKLLMMVDVGAVPYIIYQRASLSSFLWETMFSPCLSSESPESWRSRS